MAKKLIAKGAPLGQLYLARYGKVTRIVPNTEVAQHIKDLLGDTGIGIPENVVTPQLRVELEKIGVTIEASEKAYADKKAAYKEALEAGLSVDNSLESPTDPDGNGGGRFSKKRTYAGSTVSWGHSVPNSYKTNDSGLTGQIMEIDGDKITRMLDAKRRVC